MTTPVTDEYIVDFLKKKGVDEDEYDEWITAYSMENHDAYDSFDEYYEISIQQMRMFSSVDWDGSDADISLQLSNAYINSDYFH